MDKLDELLFDAVQEEFPVCEFPYAEIAARCGTTTEAAEQRINAMRASGVIRRLGAVVSSRALGMETTLAAADVEPEAVESAASMLDCLPEVTHSYLREGRPNLWFTLVAGSRAGIEEIVEKAGTFPGVLSVAEFPAERVFKLRVKVIVSSERKHDELTD